MTGMGNGVPETCGTQRHGTSAPIPLPVAGAPAPGFYARRFKRPLDLAAALTLLLLGAPLWVAVALSVRLALGSPVLFRQRRTGQHGTGFVLLKFRSMRAERFPDEPDGARLSGFGRWLRASALDEAPQLINVLRGEMSLVGPRPLPEHYTALLDRRQAERLAVRPGLAGPAVAQGRNALRWPERLEWDARYAGAVTLGGDWRALRGSASTLLSGRGANAPGHVTSPPLSDPAV